MEVKILYDAGRWDDMYIPMLAGIGLSYGITSQYHDMRDIPSDVLGNLDAIAERLARKPIESGEQKFLEFLPVLLDINAPLFWWNEADTYRIGFTSSDSDDAISMAKLSESTMHTLKRDGVTQANFEYPIQDSTLLHLQKMIKNSFSIDVIKNVLPSGFLQRRICITNYKTIKHIYNQRDKHRLPQWQNFIYEIKGLVLFNKYIGTGEE